MKIYLGTIELEKMEIFLDSNPNVYAAPEEQTVFIQLGDFSGHFVSFRLGRSDYDAFRKKIIDTEGYPR